MKKKLNIAGLLLRRGRLVVTLLLVFGTVQASDWVSVGQDESNNQYFVDLSSIQLAGPIRVAWLKTVRNGAHDDAEAWAAGLTIQYSLDRVSFNCAEKVARTEEHNDHYWGGATKANGSPPSSWYHAPPDSTVEAVMQFICAWKPK